jgi:hypothetical protein
MPLPESNIGEWTTTQLVKFIKDILENQPPRNLPNVVIGSARINGDLALKGRVTFPGDPNFHPIGATGAPPFTNAWVNWGAPNFSAGYWIDPFGFVHLQGVIKSGTVGSSAFTLPPGLRPLATAGPFAVMSNGAVGRVDVGADGTVTPITPSSNVYVSLHGVIFQAA